MLAAAAHKNGLDRPLDDKNMAVVEAERFGVEPLEEVLKYGMEHGHPAAAAAAARILGRIGTADELLGAAVPAAAKQKESAANQAAPSPLAAALQSPYRRLRLAAAAAIVRLQPIRQFAGSSRVPDVLAFLASARGARRALAASGSLEEARDLAGLLSSAGFQANAATTGRDLLLRAAQSPDCEFALIDVTIDHPTADMLVQQLRHDPRTAMLRIGIIASAGRYEQAERIAGGDPLAKAFPRSHDEKSLKWQLDQLAALDADNFVGFEARQQETLEALFLLGSLARTSSDLYDLQRTQDAVIAALANPDRAIAVQATAVLAELNAPDAQRALVETADHFDRPLALRQAAGKAFRKNVEKFGMRLTAKQVQHQYDVFNQSMEEKAPTRQVLSFILDSIEASSRAPQKKDKLPEK